MSDIPPAKRSDFGFTSVIRRVRCLWVVKFWGTLACSVGFMLLYFAAQRWGWREAVAVPLTPLDAWVGFDPRWTLVYESLWLMLPIAPWLAGRAEHIRRYLLGFGLMCAVAFPAFFLWPMDAPRPSELPDYMLYRWLVAIDGTRNSFPSMHAALGLYTLLVTSDLLRPLVTPGVWRIAVSSGGAWLFAILYATLATKQHGFIDLPPGALLGGVAYLVAWRAWARSSEMGLTCKPSETSLSVPRSSGPWA